jgi:DNA-binding CsgD family transcriptional regulator
VPYLGGILDRDMEPGVAPPSLVGRAEELQRLETALAEAADGRGSTVLIAGEAGIGKTRLASELGERAREAGATVLSGRCIDLVGSGLPYLPLVEALRPLRGSPALADFDRSLQELPRLVPELTEAPELAPAHPRDPDSQLLLFEEMLAVLEHLGTEAPVVLIVEDLHWADGSTLDLVSFLAHAAREHRLLLVATYRSDEIESESSLRRLVAELLRAREAAALTLEPLGRDEVARLLGRIAEARVPAGLVDEIYERSEGNPFFAEELLAAGRRGEETLTRALRDLLLQRLAGLDDETRSVLRVSAAAGRDVPYRLLAAVGAVSEAQLVEALREAVEHDVLLPDQPPGSFRFRHALLAEAVYTTVLPGEREQLHASLARALTDEPGLAASSIAAELAHHWEAAGQPVEALRASIDAARDAEAVSGPAEALRHLELVLELWPQVDDPEALVGLDLAGVLARAAEAAYVAGVGARAADLMRNAISLTDHADDVQLGLLYERVGTFLLPIGEREEALSAFERAVELVPEQPPSAERVRVLAALGHGLMLSWRHEESLAACRQALAVSDAIEDDRPALRALTVLGKVLHHLGRGAEGIESLRDARERARTLGVAPDELRSWVLLSDALLIAGRLHEAAREALEGVAAARRRGYGRTAGLIMAANAAEAYLGMGRWDRAEELLDDALRVTGGFRPESVHIVRAELELGRGELEAARGHLEACWQAAVEPQMTANYACLLAELALWEGRYEDAAGLLEGALRSEAPGDAQTRGARLCALALRAEAELAQPAAVRRDAQGVAKARRRAEQLVERARRSADGAVAVMPDAAGWLAIAEAEHSRVEGRPSPERWQSAVSVWDELRRPYPAAYCRWRYAEALLAAGSSRMEAALPAREAYRVARDLDARLLQGELDMLARRARLDLADHGAEEPLDEENALGLTPREREVLQLLARGYTNREIAAELVISVKTASVHVSHILRKLDVPTRIDAARIAQRLAPPPPAAPE